MQLNKQCEQGFELGEIDVSGLRVLDIKTEGSKNYALPFFNSKVAAGFPSPADDFVEQKLDLNRYLIKHPAASFFVRASGNSMIKAGIKHNDLLLVDRAIEAKNKSIVIAVINNELTVKQILKQDKQIYLLPANPNYRPIKITAEMNFEIWGVVTNVIHSLSH